VPVTFIAEASSNHDQDLSRALDFVDAAADCGCDAVKFQLFRVRELFAPEILAKSAKHLNLDGKGAEYEAGHCWLPNEIAPVIASIREGERADGRGFKEPAAAELPDREWRADPPDGLRPMRHVRASWEPA
jgi:sialic acid synthase SpsE